MSTLPPPVVQAELGTADDDTDRVGPQLGVELLPPYRRGGRAAPAAAEAPAAAAPAAAGEPDDDEQPDGARIPDLEESDDSDCELAEEHDDGEENGDTAAWKENDLRQFCARDREGGDDFGPRLEQLNPASSLLDYAKHFLPMEYIGELAEQMQANGRARWTEGNDLNYKNWFVTTNDVLQWIGCWMYMLAFFTPSDGFGPTYDLKTWLGIGHPGAQRGIFWFKQMQACFELPTYGSSSDPFNATRKFWDTLRDAFFAAVTCGWVMCLDESMVKWLGRGMPGFMVVQRKPTPKGLELHTLCCAICGILIWFEVWEGKKAMATKPKCAEQKEKLGSDGPWRSVALTLRLVEKCASRGRVVIADSWFGSVPCILALYDIGLFAVMNAERQDGAQALP
ncbi:hypothetical protein EMIHUDRAFT_229385 [Emiliania huxleyi CCMP1516]|uniref:PiggyBac transposable element-derived protein domain-containing protein n=2 Tax=Emiliania huxleyi TaxID=2903 RepID=A0A0D3KD25_EMIH1|nr:hypothetical protein EMIHUDRAFT_229385 [Emiliania huxleyi CCMP1516]EOD33660.1 hypothetical protein EMIHUDRAFT_229385 [Emiliania huxleyi CCMP1516]|eukprot:XP_005786089.1 hypothetical protein EMIHUDRAFT_229385 [Emiliania huxleyi CCMP1516]